MGAFRFGAWGLGCLAALTAQQAGGGSPQLIQPAQVGRVCEVLVPAPTDAANPYDPACAALEAEFTAPSGKRLRTPGFFMIPHRQVVEPPEKRVARKMRIYFNAEDLPAKRPVELLVDDLRLVDRDKGETVALDDFESPLAWDSQGAAASTQSQPTHSGKGALRLTVSAADKPAWPGAGRSLGDADWQRFDEMRLWVCPVSEARAKSMSVEFLTPEGKKVQQRLDLSGAPPGKWTERVWRFPPRRDTVRFEPAGEAQWRARLMPLEAGAWKSRFIYRDAGGEQTWELPFPVAAGEADGFIRVSPRDKRYLEFPSGRPYFPIGVNLLGQELGLYRHFLDALSAHGGNFIRIWLSPKTLGFELEPGRYAQDRSAQLDALFDLCRERGVYVMACLMDFREAGTLGLGSYWDRSPYNAAAGGPCQKPEEVFTNEAARAQYQSRLRYAVARWGACPAVLAWEFFNEVNITEGWKTAPESVRAWHAEMGAFLRRLDPYGRLITSSFGGLEDDPLWAQPTMDVAQRHFYLTPGASFVSYAANAIASLAPHAKPALIGEFGRRKNEYADVDSSGLSLHNGLWASALSGGCGTAMSWWWQWIDENGLWRHFASLGAFVQGVDWPSEAFAPLAADLSAQPDPQAGFGPLRVAPVKGSFQPAPFNQPVETTLKPDGRIETPEWVSDRLHGTRNHPDLHNPVTFRLDYSRAGEFAIFVAGVSRSGGAGLTLSVDGAIALQKDFPSGPEDKEMIRRYDGRYAVAVPAGRHAVKVENHGADWLVVAHYEFSGVRSTPPLRLIGLRGERTVLAWLWNETHTWDRTILGLTAVTPRRISATLRDVAPGRWRARSFDPWTGQWGEAMEETVGNDGRLALALPELASDAAWRLEKVD